MSINAISSVSLYEYYYTINRESAKKKNSPIADEMKKYGLTPTDDEQLNIAMLKRAQNIDKSQQTAQSQEIPYSDRPWADLMYQLGLSFNPDPKDDIQDIKDELTKLTAGVADDELDKEVKDLETYVENLYLKFEQNNSSTDLTGVTLTSQLNNMSMLNQVNFM
ncbi:hypothetical protein IJ531_03270 [bacterium]|nr:hypothetical protein [bacterium]